MSDDAELCEFCGGYADGFCEMDRAICRGCADCLGLDCEKEVLETDEDED